MDKMDVVGGRAYDEEEGEELDPEVEWKQAGDEQDVVEIRLPGFRKEHVRVQVDNYGVLRVTGGRPAARGGGRRWVSFTKDLRLPEGCDADGVRARFEDDRLLITLPIVAAAAGDAASPTTRTPSPEPLPRTSSFQPPFSLPPPPRLPPPPGKPNFFEPKLRPPLLPPSLPPPPVNPTAFEPKLRPPPREPASRPLPSFPTKPPTVSEPEQPPPPPPPSPPPAKPSAFEPKFRPSLPPTREPVSRPLPSFPAKPPSVSEPKPSSPPPPPPPPAKPTAFEPKFRPSLPPTREPISRPLPPFPSTAFEPKQPQPPPPAPAPLFPVRPPPPPVPSTSFMSRPPPPAREPARLPSFPPPPPPPPPPVRPTFFDSKHWLSRRQPDHAPPPPEPTNTSAAAERKPWAPPAIVPGPKTTEPEPRPSLPAFPPRKQNTAATVPEPESPMLSDIPIAMSSPSPPPPPPPPRRRLADAKEKMKIQEGAGKVRLPLLEKMKKKEEKKMEGRKAREAANSGSGTPLAVDQKREATPNVHPPASRDTATTTDLVANMAAAAAVLVGIVLSVWRTMSGSSN
ncbi:unnamed protein product [Alopecurus aequalis]